ncbi:hypothetical protein L6452_26034 [Arctium lappa]|uniref:Uncharacterized protein n=1 Tax=Arctium lappa TaxID=4217 RepID=A0ACB9ABI8_ARCLA|nr:hypothetical protein L6452_26034 [Arctium lappa]
MSPTDSDEYDSVHGWLHDDSVFGTVPSMDESLCFFKKLRISDLSLGLACACLFDLACENPFILSLSLGFSISLFKSSIPSLQGWIQGKYLLRLGFRLSISRIFSYKISLVFEI